MSVDCVVMQSWCVFFFVFVFVFLLQCFEACLRSQSCGISMSNLSGYRAYFWWSSSRCFRVFGICRIRFHFLISSTSDEISLWFSLLCVYGTCFRDLEDLYACSLWIVIVSCDSPQNLDELCIGKRFRIIVKFDLGLDNIDLTEAIIGDLLIGLLFDVVAWRYRFVDPWRTWCGIAPSFDENWNSVTLAIRRRFVHGAWMWDVLYCAGHSWVHWRVEIDRWNQIGIRDNISERRDDIKFWEIRFLTILSRVMDNAFYVQTLCLDLCEILIHVLYDWQCDSFLKMWRQISNRISKFIVLHLWVT